MTPQQCAQSCLNIAGCLSFNAGELNEFEQGHCYLSYDNRYTDPNDTLTGITQLDYYEKIAGGLKCLHPHFAVLIAHFSPDTVDSIREAVWLLH